MGRCAKDEKKVDEVQYLVAKLHSMFVISRRGGRGCTYVHQ